MISFETFRKEHPEEFYFIETLLELYFDAEDDKCEKTCQTFLEEEKLDQRFNHYFNFMLSNECGTDMKTLGVKVAQTFGNFTCGDDNFFLNKISQSDVLFLASYQG